MLRDPCLTFRQGKIIFNRGLNGKKWNVNRNESDVTCQDYNGACAQSLPNEFKSEVNSI